MQLSARNRIKGKVKKVEKGVVAAAVKVEITGPATITSVITKEAVEELALKEGDQVFVIVKSTEVMVAKE
jgi:molybdate transport system regulatory protein